MRPDARARRALKTIVITFVTALAGFCFACSGGDSASEAKKATFLAYQQAVQDQDLATLRRVLSKEALAEIEQSGVDLETAVEMIASMTPSEVRVQTAAVDQNELLVNGSSADLGATQGRIRFIEEDGEWKIANVSWEVTADLAVSASGGALTPWDPDSDIKIGGWRLNAPKFDAIEDKYLARGSGVEKPVTTAFIKDGQPQPKFVVRGEGAEFDHLAFSPDGSYLVTASYGDYMVRLWDAATWTPLDEHKMENRPTGIDFAPSAEYFVTGDVYSNLNVWRIENGRLSEPVEKPAAAGKHLAVAISGNGKLLATVSFDEVMTLWDVESMTKLRRIKPDMGFRCVAFSPTAPILAAGLANDNKFVLWDLRKGKGRVISVPKVSPQSDCASIGFSPDGRFIVTGHSESSISVWDVAKQKQLKNFYVRDASTNCVRFSPDGSVFATAQSNNNIYIWESGSAQLKATLMSHEGSINKIAFHPNGAQLVSTSDDHTMIVWE